MVPASPNLIEKRNHVEIPQKLLNSLPFDTIPSRLCTLTILQYIDKNDVFCMLQKLSHKSRAYGSTQKDILQKNLGYRHCFAKISNKRSFDIVLALYGKPNEVLQLM